VFEKKGAEEKKWTYDGLHIFILHNYYYYYYYYYCDQIKEDEMMRWMRHLPCMRVMKKAYRILVGKPTGKRPPGSPRH